MHLVFLLTKSLDQLLLLSLDKPVLHLTAFADNSLPVLVMKKLEVRKFMCNLVDFHLGPDGCLLVLSFEVVLLFGCETVAVLLFTLSH
jgi:hypothetical protein